jgi:hypothetical protein
MNHLAVRVDARVLSSQPDPAKVSEISSKEDRIIVARSVDASKLRHDLNNVAFVLSLVEEMFSNHGEDPELRKQAGAALNSEVNRIRSLVDMLKA